ncbi:hypothetical protein F0562_033366 [Nyssa sinensis]|uniref:RRM domain-containing protein n=1 Tax=Nyssa sinensis TaxID=561372 RepID=A0A5J5AVQ3_9ASTE|nr:hypothetical protein F0562_033366 [Nyssa sinensis]
MISQAAYIYPAASSQRLDRVVPPAMLSLGGFPPAPPCNTIPHDAISLSLLFPNRTYQNHFSFCSNQGAQLGFCAPLGQIRSMFCVYALKSRRNGGNSLLEIDDIDDDYEDEEDDDEEDNDDDDDDDDEEGFIPLRNMKEWIENKPRGFGEGKVYDTSIEDKLFEEMEQSRQAQLANINKLKNNPEKPNTKKEQLQKQKASEAVLSGSRVRLVNLPKKKNIHRDLQLAFKGVPGIINIIPAVSGNKKTKDPICKGLAFVDFKSEDQANRFVQMFSRQSITFGKIQKQIKCEIMNLDSLSSAYEQSNDGTYNAPQLEVLSLERDPPDADFDMDHPSPDSWEETASDEFEGVSAQWEDIEENIEPFSLSEPSSGDSMEQITESATNSLSSQQQEKIRANGKKLVAKRKGVKVPKSNIPGSANRLKIKEKAVLTDVFSKYGQKTASAVIKQKS